MSSLVPSFVLGGITIPQLSGIELEQEYTPLEGADYIRMSNGTVKKITVWNGKLETKINGFGRVPSGLIELSLDYTQTLEMRCVAPRAIQSASNVIVLPTARRTDLSVQAIGVAILAGYNMVETALSMATNTATLTVVSGATAYMALYFPQITVYASPPVERYDRIAARWRWTLEAQEA